MILFTVLIVFLLNFNLFQATVQAGNDHKIQFLGKEWTIIYKSPDGLFYIDFHGVERSDEFVEIPVLWFPDKGFISRLSLPRSTYAIFEVVRVDCKGNHATVYNSIHDATGRILMPVYRGSGSGMSPVPVNSALKDISEFICNCFFDPQKEIEFLGKRWKFVAGVEKPGVAFYYVSDHVREGNSVRIPVLNVVSDCFKQYYGIHRAAYVLLYEYVLDCAGRFSLLKATGYDRNGIQVVEEVPSQSGLKKIMKGSPLYYVEKLICGYQK